MVVSETYFGIERSGKEGGPAAPVYECFLLFHAAEFVQQHSSNLSETEQLSNGSVCILQRDICCRLCVKKKKTKRQEARP